MRYSHTITTAISIVLLFLVALAPRVADGRAAMDVVQDRTLGGDMTAQGPPAYCIVAHRVGKMELGVNNNGTLGDGWAAGGGLDCFTGALVPSLEYPKNSNIRYLFASAFWIGAVVGRDTLVSTGADGWQPTAGTEFSPDESPFGDIIYRTLRMPENPELYDLAVSEEDYICTYADTLRDGVLPDVISGRAHTPLNIRVTQKSYAWSYAYAEDFVLFDYEIRNIGTNTLHDVYMGLYNDSDVGFDDPNLQIFDDDICGFKETFVTTSRDGCTFLDTVNLAWIADNDGDPDGAGYSDASCPHVTAMRIVRTPADNLNVSFNWWISNGNPAFDYGPREQPGVGAWPEPFRDFGTGCLGTPEGDANKYYILRNREFDFDQIYTASIQINDPLWALPPEDLSGNWSDGFDTRYLLSFGPFDIDPGERLPISFAYVAGEDLHRNPANVDNLPNNPDAYYAGLDFSDLATNSTWASKVYDNPGVDTDDDGYAGKRRVCCGDSAYSIGRNEEPEDLYGYSPDTCEVWYYEGDNVPDFQGASPPPAPEFWLEPTVGAVRIRFNGTRSETEPDLFSRKNDFEGYRVYIGRDERESSYSLAASYDIEDYNKYVYNLNLIPEPGWELYDTPYTLDSLKVLYGESFDPRSYPLDNPYRLPGHPDSVFYFAQQDFNVSEFGVTSEITKVYPEQPYPSSLNPYEANEDELTPEGNLKYFEYELVLEDLLPTVEWWINVSAFDFGSPESGLPSLETSKTIGAQAMYPLAGTSEVAAQDLKVFVYPNPYRSDGDYRTDGIEGRMEEDRPNDRVRAVHFGNLPASCTIRIYTLDGDLVREIRHDVAAADPTASHDQWDLITRNTQKVVSGLYYWTVESDQGDTQVGKLVIIM